MRGLSLITVLLIMQSYPRPPQGAPTCQRALDAVEMGEAVGSWRTRGPWGDGPQVGLQTVEGRQAAVILEADRSHPLASAVSRSVRLAQAPPSAALLQSQSSVCVH